jgi:hypothetical protein
MQQRLEKKLESTFIADAKEYAQHIDKSEMDH